MRYFETVSDTRRVIDSRWAESNNGEDEFKFITEDGQIRTSGLNLKHRYLLKYGVLQRKDESDDTKRWSIYIRGDNGWKLTGQTYDKLAEAKKAGEALLAVSTGFYIADTVYENPVSVDDEPTGEY